MPIGYLYSDKKSKLFPIAFYIIFYAFSDFGTKLYFHFIFTLNLSDLYSFWWMPVSVVCVIFMDLLLAICAMSLLFVKICSLWSP